MIKSIPTQPFRTDTVGGQGVNTVNTFDFECEQYSCKKMTTICKHIKYLQLWDDRWATIPEFFAYFVEILSMTKKMGYDLKTLLFLGKKVPY